MTKNHTIYKLEGGEHLRLTPVAAFLIERAQAGIPMPTVPIYTDEETGAEYENPTDPNYLREVQEADMRRSGLVMTAAVLFGASLCDENGEPVDPPDDGWDAKLAYVGIDWRKPLDGAEAPPGLDEKILREKSYILYVILGADDAAKIMPYLISSGGGYQSAVDTFPGDAPRAANSRVRTKRRR